MANEIYTGESESVGVNEKGNFEIKKKNQPKKNKNLVINQTLEICLNQRVTNMQQKEETNQGLKILTPNQILSRLPITLAQLKAGNNSQKLANEIRQLFIVQIKKNNKKTS